MRKNKIVITGGAGFVGTNLINLFARLVDYLMDDNNRLKKALHLKYLNRHSGLTFGGTSSRHSRTHDK